MEEWHLAFSGTGQAEPCWVLVRETGRETPVLLLPLVRRRARLLVSIEAPDIGITDYNAPLLPPGFDFESVRLEIWKALVAALPPSDYLSLGKLPELIEGARNPLVDLPFAVTASLSGNNLTIPDKWEDYHYGLERRFRKEIERSWRVFSRQPETRFQVFHHVGDAMPVLEALERLQSTRIASLGLPYMLDDPRYANFYRSLVGSGLADGSVRLTALMAGDEVVAALLGITRGKTLALVRLGTGAAGWQNCSPGRLIIYKTMEVLHSQGFREFDYTVGDYPYKRRLGSVTVPLHEILVARSIWGLPHVLTVRLRNQLRPLKTWLRRRLSRLSGKS